MSKKPKTQEKKTFNYSFCFTSVTAVIYKKNYCFEIFQFKYVSTCKIKPLFEKKKKTKIV